MILNLITAGPTGKIVKAKDSDEYGDDYAGYIRDTFADNEIRPAAYEKPFEAYLDDRGNVVGASVFGMRDHEGCFSVVVDNSARRQGVARKLVQSIIDQHRGVELVPWVVNRDMAKLLESMGFESDSRNGWSQDNPHMRLQA